MYCTPIHLIKTYKVSSIY